MKLSTPNITQAQIVAIVGAVLGLAVAAGLPISDELQSQIINLVMLLSAALVGGDAVIRNGRSRIQAAREAPQPTATATVTTGTGTASSAPSGSSVTTMHPLAVAPTVAKKPTRKRPPAKPKGK